jgi:hypothetical protein
MVRAMLIEVNISAFPILLERLEAQQCDAHVFAIILRALSWNVNFAGVSEDSEFLSRFFDVFSKTFTAFSRSCDLGNVSEENAPICSDFLVCFYMILSILANNHATHLDAPFPCCKFVDRKLDTFAKTQTHFQALFNLAGSPQKIETIHIYALRTLEAWFHCNPVPSVNLLVSPDFIAKVNEFSKQRPLILHYLLLHHFDVLVAQYIASAYIQGNEAYFSALAVFFRKDTLGSTVPTETVLRDQWLSCSDESIHPTLVPYLNALYEVTGSLLLSCLFFLSRAEKKLVEEAFVVLAVLAPVLSMVHFNGHNEDLKELLDIFVQTSVSMNHNFSCIDLQTICGISSVLCKHFQFCMEQILADACEFLPKRAPHEISRMLIILRPFFETIEFDTENRVICRETDMQFMKFSCYTFVASLMTSFTETADATLNSEIVNMWRVLVIRRGRFHYFNFQVIFLSLLFAAYDPRNHVQAGLVLHYLFRIAPQQTSDHLGSLYTFGYAAHQHYHETDESSGFSPETSVELDEEIPERNSHHLIEFFLQMTAKLVTDSVRPFIPCLPAIFAFCLIHISDYFRDISEVMTNVTNELLIIIPSECRPYLLEVMRNFSAISRLIGKKDGASMTDLLSPEVAGDSSASFFEIARSITAFFTIFNSEMADQLGHEFLQWGMCHGDLHHAAAAIACYRGNLHHATPLIVDLSARALWSVSDALKLLGNDVSPYLDFIAEQLKMLRALAMGFAEKGTLGSESTLLWIAIECLKCNSQSRVVVFSAALDLFEYILMFPQIFRYLAGIDSPVSDRYTQRTFTKFHQHWGDTFHGVYSFLYGCECSSIDIWQLIRVVNFVIQTGFKTLFGDGEASILVALLSLLPWMWAVVITEMSRFLFDSPQVLIMEATFESLKRFISDPAILNCLSFIGSDEDVDVFANIATLCEIIVPQIPTSDLLLITKFFHHCLVWGDKSLSSPTYAVVAHIVSHAIDKQPILERLGPLTAIVEKDQNESRCSYRDLYMEVCAVVKDLAPEEEQSGVWPDLVLFERIVVVKIPHLYEVNVSDIANISILDLTSFPPLLPFDVVLLQGERFKRFFAVLSQYRFEPFMQWYELTGKLLASLVGRLDWGDLRRTIAVGELKLKTTFSTILKQIEITPQNEINDTEQNQEEEEDLIEEKQPAADPYAFVFLTSQTFVPSVSDVNIIGNEQFEDGRIGNETNFDRPTKLFE